MRTYFDNRLSKTNNIRPIKCNTLIGCVFYNSFRFGASSRI